MRRRLAIVTVLALLGVTIVTAVPDASAGDVRRPSGRLQGSLFQHSTPEAQGMNSSRLADGIDFLVAHKEVFRIHSVVVLRNGTIVVDARFYPFGSRQRHSVASVTKSVTSTLIGIAIDEGYIQSVDERVIDFFPDHTIDNLDDRKRSMTIENLLTMRSGFACDPANSEATLTEMTNSPNWVQFALDLPMAAAPGEDYVYCSPGVHLLSAILQQATGMTTLEFAQEHLFAPLGIADVLWPRDPQGVHDGWGDIQLLPHDMLKLGYLFLNDGDWFGDQIVPSSWTEAATTLADDLDFSDWPEDTGYGYLWWIYPDFYAAEGRGEQRVHVYPDENLVVALNAGDGVGNFYPTMFEYFDTYVLGAIESADPLPPNPAGATRLQSSVGLAALSDEGPPQPVPPPPLTAVAISDQTYELEPNIYHVEWARFNFAGGAEALVELGFLEIAGIPPVALQVGLDGVNRFSPWLPGAQAAAKGSWEDEDRFVMVLDEIALINLWRFTSTFSGNRITVEMLSLAGGELPATIEGEVP